MKSVVPWLSGSHILLQYHPTPSGGTVNPWGQDIDSRSSRDNLSDDCDDLQPLCIPELNTKRDHLEWMLSYRELSYHTTKFKVT